MVEETFEEKFPELKIKVQQRERIQDWVYSRWTMEQLFQDIEKHCLSKSRVKEAIKNRMVNLRGNKTLIDGGALLKELGLEE